MGSILWCGSLARSAGHCWFRLVGGWLQGASSLRRLLRRCGLANAKKPLNRRAAKRARAGRAGLEPTSPSAIGLLSRPAGADQDQPDGDPRFRDSLTFQVMPSIVNW